MPTIPPNGRNSPSRDVTSPKIKPAANPSKKYFVNRLSGSFSHRFTKQTPFFFYCSIKEKETQRSEND